MMSPSPESDAFVAKAEAIYNDTLKEQLEAEHFGELIALDPETGEFVLAGTFREIVAATLKRFGTRPTYTFRVGGGGAVRVGASRNARVS
jgi:hypothetical protein